MRSFVFIFVLFFLSISTSAHLSNGNDREMNGYIVDFGYNPETPIEDELVTLRFLLQNETTRVFVPLETIELNILHESQVIFAGIIRDELRLRLDEPGSYTLSLKLTPQNSSSLETTFELIVKKEPFQIIYLPIAMVVLASLSFLVSRLQWKKSN